jgi:hypothetical protein
LQVMNGFLYYHSKIVRLSNRIVCRTSDSVFAEQISVFPLDPLAEIQLRHFYHHMRQCALYSHSDCLPIFILEGERIVGASPIERRSASHPKDR